MAVSHPNTRHRGHAGNRLETVFYASILYPLCLVSAILLRLFRLPGRLVRADFRHRKSVFAEAMEMTHSAVPWIFMGR